MELDLENPLPTTIQSLFIIESDQNPCQNRVLNPNLRREIVSFICLFSCDFDYSVSYIAVNYLDRFLFTQNISMGNPWAVQLVAITCVSLALKMMHKTGCSVSEIQHDGGFIFDVQTVCQMEKIILDALKWRMRSVTPFSFINFFIELYKFKDRSFVQALKARATEIIFKAQKDVKVLEFKPSLSCATALLCASHELFPLEFPCFEEAISTCEYVNKEKLYICYKKMQEIAKDGYESVVVECSSKTPVNVLDLEYDHSTVTTTSLISSDNNEEEQNSVEEANATDTKRRRIS